MGLEPFQLNLVLAWLWVILGFSSGFLLGLHFHKENWQNTRPPSYGITVNGCFILGLDGDTPEVFDDVLAFVRDSGLHEVQVTFMTAFPGTPLYGRLKREGRILRDDAWELCTLFDINFMPRQMTVEQLQGGFLKLVRQLYSSEETQARRQRFRERLKKSQTFGSRASKKRSRETLVAA